MIITIIILIILAAVTINAAFNSGIINTAINGAEKYTIAQKKEMDEFSSLENYLGNNLNRIYGEGGDTEEENPPPVIITGVIEFGGLSWNNGQANVTITKTTSDDYKIEYKVTNSTGTITTNYTEIANGGTVESLNLGDVVTARLTDGTNHGDSASINVTDIGTPTVTVTKGTVTTNSITVTASSIDKEAGMPSTVTYKYYIKETTEINYKETADYTTTDTSVIFTGLTQNISYDIKVTTEDKAGNEGIGEAKGIVTGTIPNAGGDEIQIGAIKFGGLSWNNGKANVTITKTISDDYKIEYKVTNSTGTITTNYTEIANGGTVDNLNLGDVVTARLTDGTNKGNSASITVADKNPPTAGITVGTVTRTEITVTATGTDAESGVKNYTFEYKLSTASTYTGTTTKTTTSHTFEGLTPGQTYNFKVTVTDKAGNTKEAIATGSTLAPTPMPTQDGSWDSTNGVNTPKVEGTGLIPVYYNGTSWVDLTESSTTEEWNKWYDYSSQQWANARTKDGSMWVWIPRYEYKIDKGIDVNFMRGTSTTVTSGYILHPAFSTDIENGGWDKDVEGFWVAKYPAGWQNGTDGTSNSGSNLEASTEKYATSGNKKDGTGSYTTYVGSTASGQLMSYPAFKANNYVYNYISVGDAYKLSQTIAGATRYGLSNIDSHLQKNSEWGAVAYLAISKYGTNDTSGAGQNTTNKSGNPTGVYAVTSPEMVTDTSTTNNITGVYDMSGCAYEMVSGFFKGGETKHTTGMPTSTSSKYVTLYTKDNKKGDATNETKNWHGSEADFINTTFPTFARGSTWAAATSYAGVTAYSRGGRASSSRGFRVVLIPN